MVEKQGAGEDQQNQRASAMCKAGFRVCMVAWWFAKSAMDLREEIRTLLVTVNSVK